MSPITLSEKVALLRKSEFFEHVPKLMLARIADKMTLIHAEAGTVIVQEGAEGDAIYVIADGTAAVQRKDKTLVLRGRGEWIGEMALLDDSPRSASVIAESNLMLLRLNKGDFRSILEESREITRGFLKLLTRRLRETGHAQSDSAAAEELARQGAIRNLEPNRLFAGRYLIEKKLGAGGAGIVYRATDTTLNSVLAVKILVNITEDDRAVDRLKREVLLARKVNHPNICRIHDIGQSDGIHYVTMDLINGISLYEKLKKQRVLAVEDGLPIIRQVLDGLKEIHRANIIHRDLKPANIMLSTGGGVFIMDFGLAISSDLQARFTRTDQLVGTPLFMAPELLKGEKIDHRADIYSVGVILYEMFAGRAPYEGDSLWELLSAVWKSDPLPPSLLNRDITPKLERAIARAMAREPGQRYSSVSTLLRAINSL